MHCVYKLTFTKRKERGEEPYMYIGSKSNSTLFEGVIYDKRNKPYYGSSTYKFFKDYINEDIIETELLATFEDYKETLKYEYEIQKHLDVVADTEYFNLSLASVNTFSDSDYATYKNTRTGKTVRLPRNHKKVLNGEYVGVSKGTILTSEERKKRGSSGDKNGFYGKTHSDETRSKIAIANSRETRSPEKVQEWIENIAKKPKSEEHKKKIGRKNLIMLKNKETGATVRIHKDLSDSYDKKLWVNPYTLSEKKSTGSKWINNGIENIKIKSEKELPEGWKFGRLYQGWNNNKRKKDENIAN
jgi:hypothetical protein